MTQTIAQSNMILRMKLNKWSDMEINVGSIRVPVKVGHSIGYMEVYDCIEKMRQDYPDETYYTQIQEVQPDDKQLDLPFKQ